MKNLIPLYLALVFAMPLCWGMDHEDSDEYRKWVLHKTAQKGLLSYKKMHDTILTIIANRYTGMENLTEEEQAYLLKEYLLRDGETEDLSFTKQVFFERFLAWASLKNISATMVSKSESILSINPNSVPIDQILAKIEAAPHRNYRNNCAPSVPQVDKPLSLILPTEEIPFIFDDDEGSGYFSPERLS
jgi:hypothetical protein